MSPGSPEMRARQRRVGGAMAYVQIAMNICIALAYTPFMVRTLGQANYGLFAIAGAMASYLVILDMGLADSVVRRLVGLHGKDDRQGERDFLGSMLSLYGALGLVVAGNPLNATLVAHERFMFLRSLEMATLVLVTATNIAALLMGGGVVSVVVIASIGAACATMAKWLMVWKRLGLPLMPRPVRRAQVTEMSSYAAPIFVSMVVEQIFWKLDNLLIGARLGAAAVAVYAIGVMFNKYFMSFATAISRVMMPDLIRRIDAGADDATLTDYLIKISRWQAMVLMLVLSGLVLFGQQFILAWMGPEFGLSYWVLVFTLCPYAFEMIGNVRNILLQVKGLLWWRAGIFLAAALLNIPATLLAIQHWGLIGAAICTGTGLLAAYLGTAWVLSNKAGIPVFVYQREVWRGIAPALMLAAACGMLLRALLPDVGWQAFALKVVLYSAVYVCLMWLVGMNRDERSLARTILGRRHAT